MGSHLVDQLLLPLVLSGKGLLVTLKPSSHTLTNNEVIASFLDVPIQLSAIKDDVWSISIG